MCSEFGDFDGAIESSAPDGRAANKQTVTKIKNLIVFKITPKSRFIFRTILKRTVD